MRFLGNSDYPNLPAMLTATMLERADLESLAEERSAENFVATQEAWARAAGAIFAEAAREAFRDAERRQREAWRRLAKERHDAQRLGRS